MSKPYEFDLERVNQLRAQAKKQPLTNEQAVDHMARVTKMVEASVYQPDEIDIEIALSCLSDGACTRLADEKGAI